MRKIFTTVLFAIVAASAYAQTGSLKGTIADTVDKRNLFDAVISVLSEKDSVLIKYTRADHSGKFSLQNMREGKYILMITHPYFGDYFNEIQITNDKENNLGDVVLIPKAKLLAEVIVKTGAPIRIKGDTTVYTADSFRVRPGANVEELLRRLPGIQVDKDGKITAMGEQVKKVLVDGEEFFGSDPGIATKNLRADAVQEVQVFDKKSDQAEFTGIDDGVRDKTINLKMKEQKGYFGKVAAGGGLKDKFNNEAMLNSFKGKRKIAGYGIMSNTGQTNLDWQDAQNYGGGMDGFSSGIADDGGMYISFSNEDSYYGGRNGIPQNWDAGLHYSDKFNNNKLSINSGYKFSKINASGVTTTFSNTFLPDTTWNSDSRSNNFSSVDKHAFNLTVESTIDSMNSLKWMTKVNNNTSSSEVNYFGETLDESGQFINNSTRNSTNKSDKNNINSTLLWKHKFKKPSRTLSINTDLNWIQTNNDGLLYSLNNYFLSGVLDHRDTIDQQNIQHNGGKSVTTKFAYTEPLMKDTYLELDYSVSYNNSSNDRTTKNKSSNGKYEDVVDTLSNSFVFNRFVNTPGANIRVNKKKYNFAFGASVGFSNFVEKNITDNSKINYNYTNFFPQANFNYKFKPSENFRFNYNGSTNAPSLEQLQPIAVNTDPLNIYIGNPGLKQSFRHTFNSGYGFYNVLKKTNLFTNVQFTATQNAFVQSSTVDDVGKRVYQTVNANGVYYLNFFSSYGFELFNLQMGIGPTVNSNRNIDFINGVRDVANTKGYGIRYNINKYKENKWNFYISPVFTWNQSTASVNSAANAKYWQLEGWGNVDVNLPHKFEISSDVNVQLREKDPRFTQRTNFTNWNAALIRRFMKNNDLELKIGIYDILDQNRGYDRNFNSYSFTETYYTTLRRYWLFTITWNISKNGKPASF